MVYAHGLKRIMSKSPLGPSQLEKFKVGDLIYWSEFTMCMNYDKTLEVFHGIILSFETEYKSGRGVILANVLPIKNTIPVQIVITKLRQMKTN